MGLYSLRSSLNALSLLLLVVFSTAQTNIFKQNRMTNMQIINKLSSASAMVVVVVGFFLYRFYRT